MPSSRIILESLASIAGGYWPVAALYHAVLGVALIALFAGWRPSRRTAACGLALLLGSVSAFAWLADNPFNGFVLGVAAISLGGVAARFGDESAKLAPPWVVAIGAASIAFGWFYPHFLEAKPIWFYAFAAPVGLVPCPTLATVLGFGLVANGFGSRAWTLASGILGLFYGVFGALRLGVRIDLALVAVACAMIAVGAASSSARWIVTSRGAAARPR